MASIRVKAGQHHATHIGERVDCRGTRGSKSRLDLEEVLADISKLYRFSSKSLQSPAGHTCAFALPLKSNFGRCVA